MLEFIFKTEIIRKIKEFRSFVSLIGLMTLAVLLINFYNNFKFEQTKHLSNLFQNIYFQKTLKSISQSLIPRFENVTHVVGPGDSFDKILNKLDISIEEKQKVLNFITSKKIKFKIYENQKIKFEIDNIKEKKIIQISIPINKKKKI